MLYLHLSPGSWLRSQLGILRLALGSFLADNMVSVHNLVVVSSLLFKVGEGEVEQLAGGQRAVGAPVVQRRRLLQEHLARVDILRGKVKLLLSPQYYLASISRNLRETREKPFNRLDKEN